MEGACELKEKKGKAVGRSSDEDLSLPISRHPKSYVRINISLATKKANEVVLVGQLTFIAD